MLRVKLLFTTLVLLQPTFAGLLSPQSVKVRVSFCSRLKFTHEEMEQVFRDTDEAGALPLTRVGPGYKACMVLAFSLR